MRNMLHSIYLGKLQSALEKTVYGSIALKTPDGQVYRFTGDEPGATADIHILDWRMLPAFSAKGDIGLTEAYRDQWWQSTSLVDLFTFAMENQSILAKWLHGNWISQGATRLLYAMRRNSLKGSRRNIQAHYDLSNEFYALWLDPSMTYSSALYETNEESLPQAQQKKYDRLLDRLDRSQSGNLLEIGCGWGGLAERAIDKHDYNVTGLTLSNAQHSYSRDRLKPYGDAANICLKDYRHQNGRFDHIVSIEMFEAVGERYWSTYFGKLKSLLSSKGRAQIQTITIGEENYEGYRKRGDMFRTFIFPGGMLPSVERFRGAAEQEGLKVTDLFDFGKDYATTCQIWLHAFESKLTQIRQLGFDEDFIRVWRFYLAACVAGFTVGRTSVVQMELQHA